MKIIVTIILIILISLFLYNKGQIKIDNERAGFFLLRGGYRAWWVRYSEGKTIDSRGKWINLWCFPKFEHCDIRKLLKKQEEI